MINNSNKNMETSYTSRFKTTFNWKQSVSDYPTQANCYISIIFLKGIFCRVLPEEKELGSEAVLLFLYSCTELSEEVKSSHLSTYPGRTRLHIFEKEIYCAPKIITECKSSLCNNKYNHL